MAQFNPNELTFTEGVTRLQNAAKKAGVPEGKILTSHDSHVVKAVHDLAVKNVPDGFSKWQLPESSLASLLFIWGAKYKCTGTLTRRR